VKRIVLAFATSVAIGLALAATAPAASAPDVPKKPSGKQATTARLLAPVTARRAPNFKATAITTIQPIAPLGGGPTVLVVRRAKRFNGKLWLRVLLPIRPNGTEGWIPADIARLQKNRIRVIVRRDSRRLDVYRNGKRVAKFPVAVGKASTPTPNGRFAIAERINTRDPNGFLGPWVLPITGYSKVLNEYAGGNGRVAIHGTSEPQVIGTRASNGCVRMYNGDVRKLAKLVQAGAQVEIRKK
jgi:lipoprotein-anchoring transpeptidase ErfK/SrfK